jgi:hypothetical protein
MASMDVILAPAVALCSGRSDSTQKLDSPGDLLEGQCHHHAEDWSSLLAEKRGRE